MSITAAAPAADPTALFLENRALAYFWANRYARAARAGNIDPEDLAAEAMLALWKAAREWREDGAARFGTFASICIKHRLWNMLNGKRWRWQPKQLPADRDSGEALDVADHRHQAEAGAGADAERLLRVLPARQSRALRLYFGLEDGRPHTLDEVGQRLGLTRERVRQILQRGLRRLRREAARPAGARLTPSGAPSRSSPAGGPS